MAQCILLAATPGGPHSGEWATVRIAANNWAYQRKPQLRAAGFALERESKPTWYVYLLRKDGHKAIAFLLQNCKSAAGVRDHQQCRENWIKEVSKARVMAAAAASGSAAAIADKPQAVPAEVEALPSYEDMVGTQSQPGREEAAPEAASAAEGAAESAEPTAAPAAEGNTAAKKKKRGPRSRGGKSQRAQRKQNYESKVPPAAARAEREEELEAAATTAATLVARQGDRRVAEIRRRTKVDNMRKNRTFSKLRRGVAAKVRLEQEGSAKRRRLAKAAAQQKGGGATAGAGRAARNNAAANRRRNAPPSTQRGGGGGRGRTHGRQQPRR